MRRLLVILGVIALMPCCLGASASDLRVWWEISTRKVMRDAKPNMRAFPIQMEAARNEHEAAQLVMQADRPMNVKVSVTDLVGSKGKIGRASIELLQVQYVHIKTPSGNGFGQPGDWPDPMPAMKGTMTLEPNVNAPIWVEVKVPKDAQPGVYQGKVIIQSEEQASLEVPISLKVWNLVLPDAPNQPSAFAIWYDQINAFYHVPPEKWQEVKDKFYWFQANHWLPSDDLPVPVTSPEAAKYLNNPLAVSFRIPYSEDDAELRKTVDLVKANGWVDKGYFYTLDEPPADVFPEVVRVGKKIHAVDPSLRFLITAAPHKEMIGGPNLWCPILNAASKEILGQRQALGEEAWWYTCCAPKYPYPTYLIDDLAVSPRIMSWIQTMYRVTGTLYWSTTVWQKWNGTKYVVDGGPWEDPMRFPGVNGDGFLIYPSMDGSYDPIASMRLKMIREGMEDWEYLYQLRGQLGKAAKAIGYDSYDPWVRNDEICRRIAASLPDFDRNAEHLYATRRALAAEITETLNPPVLLLKTTPNEYEATIKSEGIIAGKVQKGAKLAVNGRPVAVASNGSFWTKILLKPGENRVAIDAALGAQRKHLVRTLICGAPPTWVTKEERVIRHFCIPSLPKGSQVDWDAVVAHGARLSSFRVPGSKRFSEEPTVAYAAYDDKGLYLAVKCLSRTTDRLVAKRESRDSDVWMDDSVELFLDPMHTQSDYFHLITNTRGTQFDERGKMGEGTYSTWNAEWKATTEVRPGYWMAFLQIPFSSIGRSARKGDTWGLNLTRNHSTIENGLSTLNPTHGFHDPTRFAEIVFE